LDLINHRRGFIRHTAEGQLDHDPRFDRQFVFRHLAWNASQILQERRELSQPDVRWGAFPLARQAEGSAHPTEACGHGH
jgi:hypothetical protein